MKIFAILQVEYSSKNVRIKKQEIEIIRRS